MKTITVTIVGHTWEQVAEAAVSLPEHVAKTEESAAVNLATNNATVQHKLNNGATITFKQVSS